MVSHSLVLLTDWRPGFFLGWGGMGSGLQAGGELVNVARSWDVSRGDGHVREAQLRDLEQGGPSRAVWAQIL